MHSMLKTVVGTLRGFAQTLRFVETLHCNVSTALLWLILCCFHAPAFAGLNDGLVAYYSFDDCSANDQSGKGNNGTINGNPQCINGVKGKAFNFNGINDYIAVPNSDSVNLTTLSISAWVHLDSFKQESIYPIVVNKENQYEFAIMGENNPLHEAKQNDVGFAFNSNWYWYGATPNSPTELLHIVISYDSNNVGSIYINGKKLKSIQYSSPIQTTSNCLLIGARGCGYSINSFFNGLIDEVRIYNRTLTPSEVTALYQQGTTPAITSITPTETVIGKPTTFEVRGQNLNPNMGFTVGDCQYSNVALAGGTPQLQKFVCTQFGAAGIKQGSIKTKPGGIKLHGFTVSAVLVPSDTPMATLTGRIKIGSSFGSGVVLSGGNTINACLTNAAGQFSCQVPTGWTGTLVPQAKGVKFSPALIYVENAQGEKILNDATTFAYIGTPLDSFPTNGLMISDWQKATSDNAKWIISTANGEINDLKSYEGRFSYRSSAIAANQISAIQTTVNVAQAADVVFAQRVSSNAGHGVLSFYIDGAAQASWSGEKAWETVKFPLTAGTHTLRWEYKKDAEVSKGSDAAWIDDLSYPASVQTRVVGQTVKATCLGATPGTLSLMTIKNPTCEQVQAYLKWLKVFRPANLKNADGFIKAVKGIGATNDTIQNALDFGGKIYGYYSSIKTAASSVELFNQLHLQTYSLSLGVGVCDVSLSDPIHQTFCNEANDAVFSLIEYGMATAAGTVVSSALIYPAAVEKTIGAALNIGSAIALNKVTEQINSVNIADDFLDEYYKGGMNIAQMRKNYGVTNTYLNVLVDAVANKKGYYNAWYGTEYLNLTVRSYIGNTIAEINKLK